MEPTQKNNPSNNTLQDNIINFNTSPIINEKSTTQAINQITDNNNQKTNNNSSTKNKSATNNQTTPKNDIYPNSKSIEQTQKKEEIIKLNIQQQLPEKDLKSTKTNNDIQANLVTHQANKQVKLKKKPETQKPFSKEKILISPPTTQVVQSKSDQPGLKMSIDNQESFKEYKIQDTLNSSANNASMYEISLGIKDGDITNDSSDYHFNNKWKLFFAKFKHTASIFTITDNYTWGTGFRVGDDNYINDIAKGISLELEQNQLSKFKNAMNTTGEIFEAQTYDYMENDIHIKVNKSYSSNSNYVFLKFEVTNTATNISNNNNEYENEKFDSFNIIKKLLSEKSFAIKKSDFNNFINIIE
nr:hypothetical protein [Borrelia coriaceae]